MGRVWVGADVQQFQDGGDLRFERFEHGQACVVIIGLPYISPVLSVGNIELMRIGSQISF